MAFMTFDGDELQTDYHFLSLDSYAFSLTLSHKQTDSDIQTFLEWEENQNTERKRESFIFNGISRGWERKSITGRFATGRFWPFTWIISSTGKDLVNNWEFCLLKITSIGSFCDVSTHFFIFSLRAKALYDFYLEIVDPVIFIHQESWLFFSVKGYCVYMVNKIIHGCW